MLGSDGIKILHVYISTAYYMPTNGITDTKLCIIYFYRACITIVLLVLPLFYHSLGHFLMTLDLRARLELRDFVGPYISRETHRSLVGSEMCIRDRYITASFILPLTRSLSDDPGFACPG